MGFRSDLEDEDPGRPRPRCPVEHIRRGQSMQGLEAFIRIEAWGEGDPWGVWYGQAGRRRIVERADTEWAKIRMPS